MDGIIRVRALERSRHRLVHGERERVLLVGPVHPDGADAVGIGDDHMLGHQVYPMEAPRSDGVPGASRSARQLRNCVYTKALRPVMDFPTISVFISRVPS